MLATIALGVAVFTTVMLGLVGILLLARRSLVASGAVSIGINGGGENDLEAAAGSTLLGTLANAGIFIPSACGGQGTCGVCLVKVTSGGGALLPTETGFINRGEAREGWRLSCQVKVKENIDIEVPAEIFDVRQWRCRASPRAAASIASPRRSRGSASGTFSSRLVAS